MRPISVLLAAVLAAGALAAVPSAAPATPAVATAVTTEVPRVRPHGRWLLDPHGRVLVLHGVNMVYKRAPYAPDATGFGRRRRPLPGPQRASPRSGSG